MRRIKALPALAAVLALLAAPGCDYTDPDRMSIITGAAIDYTDGIYELTIESIKTEGSSLDQPIETETFTTSGMSLDLAEAALERLTGSALYWGHAQALVISESAATDALAPLLDWVMRAGDLRLTVVLAVSREKDAKTIFSGDPAGSYTVSSAIAGAMREGGFSERAAGASAHRALEALLDAGSALLPAVAMAEQDGERSYALIDGGAVLVGSRFAGFLTDDEAQDILLLLGADDTRELVRSKSGAFGLKLENMSASAESDTLEDGSPSLHITLDGSCTVEYYDSTADILDEAGAQRLAATAAEGLAERIAEAIRATRKLGADVADFGEQFGKDFGESARGVALEAETDVVVTLEIADTGLVARSPASKLK